MSKSLVQAEKVDQGVLSSVDIPLAEGPVNLNWNPIMKHVNENPYEFFTTGGWGFLGASTGENQESDDDSGSESEYEQAPSESDYSEASASESFQDGSDASDDEGSGSDFSGSEGDDWDELERKAAKCKWDSAHTLFSHGDGRLQRIRRYKRRRRQRATTRMTLMPVQRRRRLQRARRQLNLQPRRTERFPERPRPTANDRDPPSPIYPPFPCFFSLP